MHAGMELLDRWNRKTRTNIDTGSCGFCSRCKYRQIKKKGLGERMSESREHKLRYNRKLEFISAFEEWMEREPPMILIFHWHRWKKRRPVWREIENGTEV